MILIAVVLGMVLFAGSPVAQARECDQTPNVAVRQIPELQWQIARLIGGVGQDQARRADTGAVFTKVSESELTELLSFSEAAELLHLNERTAKALGESWRDPSGMIWGDVVKNSDGPLSTGIRFKRWSTA